MKLKLFTLIIVLALSVTMQAQSISPSISNDYCASTNMTFTVTLPGTGYSSINVIGWATNVAPNVTTNAYNIATVNGNTVFNFDGNFKDYNNSQTYRVQYSLSGTPGSVDFTYTKIRSFLTGDPVSQPQPVPSSISAQRCLSQSFNISFTNVQYVNPWLSPKVVYGSVTTYEYLLPSGWVLNGTTSTGSNWIAGTNSVTVTSDLSHGDASAIKIRAVNSCGANLATGPEATIPISRPRATLTITGDDFICSGSKTYSISGTLPPGATVCWSSSNANVATVPTSNCGATTSLTYVAAGVVTLTASVTDCIETYTVTKDVLIGASVGGYYRIYSNYHNSGIFYTIYNSNSAIWLPANQTCEVDIYLTSPGIQSATWSMASNSYPFNWNTSGTFLSFAGISGSTAYEQRNGIFNLSAQTTCGTYTGTFTWPIVVQGSGSFRIATSPNPATDMMALTISEESPEVKALSKNEDVTVEIYSFDQSRLIKQWKFKNDSNLYSLNVANIPKGDYVLVVKKGKFKKSKQVLIKK